ncbi:unnamed protein product [Ixodes pacificus]
MCETVECSRFYPIDCASVISRRKRLQEVLRHTCVNRPLAPMSSCSMGRRCVAVSYSAEKWFRKQTVVSATC